MSWTKYNKSSAFDSPAENLDVPRSLSDPND